MPGMKQLIFFTESFPYGKGESFIENEIEYLSREFDRIYILPKTSSTQEQRSLPANCIVFPPIFRSSGELVFKGLFCFSPLFYFFKKLQPCSCNYFISIFRQMNTIRCHAVC